MDEKQPDDLKQEPRDNQYEEECVDSKKSNTFTANVPTFSSSVAKLAGTASLNTQLATTQTFSKAVSQLHSWSEPLKALNNFTLPTLDVAQSLIESVSAATRKLSETISTFAGVSQSVSQSIADASRSLNEILRPNLEVIASIVNTFDSGRFWKKYQEAAATWGGCGWVVIDDMPNDILLSIPSDYAEANRIARKYAFATLDFLKNKILETSRKKSDAIEMFALFDEGHYKSCAMMACSLIDGELFNWKIPRAQSRAVRSSPRDLTVSDESAMWAAASLSSIVPAYDHFFRWGDHFNRDVEGELNRNFLMHGMMYKKVSQVACLKLFLLLDQIIELLPCARYRARRSKQILHHRGVTERPAPRSRSSRGRPAPKACRAR